MVYLHKITHTHTQPFNGLLSGTTRVDRYQKKHSPTHTHPDHRTSFIIFLHLQRSMASPLFSLRAWQSSQTTSLQVLFGLPLGLGPSTSYSMHYFTQSSSSFRSTCPYQRSLFCCNTNAMSSIPSLSLSSLLVSLSFNWPFSSLLAEVRMLKLTHLCLECDEVVLKSLMFLDIALHGAEVASKLLGNACIFLLHAGQGVLHVAVKPVQFPSTM